MRYLHWRSNLPTVGWLAATFAGAFLLREVAVVVFTLPIEAVGFPRSLLRPSTTVLELVIPLAIVSFFTLAVARKLDHGMDVLIEPSLQATRERAARRPVDPWEDEEYSNARAFSELSLTPDPVTYPPRRNIPVLIRAGAMAQFFLISVIAIRNITVYEVTEDSTAALLSGGVGVLAVAVAEELLFRGTILMTSRDLLRREWQAVALSLVLFAIWQFGMIPLGTDWTMAALIAARSIVTGFGFYCVRVMTGHLWPAIIAHTLWGFFVFVL